MIKFHMTRTH